MLGRKVVSMTDLAGVCTSLGFENVKTVKRLEDLELQVDARAAA